MHHEARCSLLRRGGGQCSRSGGGESYRAPRAGRCKSPIQSFSRRPGEGGGTKLTCSDKVLICNGANAKGYCQYSVYKLDTCYNLPQQLKRNAATFVPDADKFYCYPYL
ncbi:hypothetical protein B0T26DRAFT_249355 [Lasiosphaeria miniovina]|uniref:Uncharacterized protein n=1 Tax=Lasiosphaeria miniovina TaxID=1954250 RepID=A0AA40AW61_9PEZI|nr:uncharacterized protein B0T26DRAFT_249355 [Lasiosphaeria miniovina]KAK0723102.1 hypothetical protein B0T26DRAFT_249355 [Lasiosphaeria miniovina]